jgi:CheY-like chemotaxis protein
MKETILLVEDSKFQKLMGEKMLLRAGYLVLLASDGREGFRLAQESLPDLILLDLLLPDVNGEEVLHSLKRDERTRNIPVIVVTNVAASNAAKIRSAGAAEYFEKSRFLVADDGEGDFLGVIRKVLCESEALRATQKLVPPLVRGQGA